jgi:hypothetical protein
MRLATELGRELGVPMRLANMAFAEMTEALNRGWENRPSAFKRFLIVIRSSMAVPSASKARKPPRGHSPTVGRQPL